MTTLVINPPNQRITFKLPTTYSDNVTPLPAGAIADIVIQLSSVAGGPYTKSIKDNSLTPDSGGLCSYPLASLGVDLTKPTYAVLVTEITGPGGTLIDSSLSPEIGFQNLTPAPPQNPSVG